MLHSEYTTGYMTLESSQGYWEIECPYGTFFVPDHLLGVNPDLSDFDDYIEGDVLDCKIPVHHPEGTIYRLTAPGYMDSTDWSPHDSLEDAAEFHDLERSGEDDEDSD